MKLRSALLACVVAVPAATVVMLGCGESATDDATTASAPRQAAGDARRAAILDTQLTVSNATSKALQVAISAGCVGLDTVESLKTSKLAAGTQVTRTGTCTDGRADVGGYVKYPNTLTKKELPVDFYANNPAAGMPTIRIWGMSRRFAEGDACVYRHPNGRLYEASREADLPDAKDMRITAVDSSTLPNC